MPDEPPRDHRPKCLRYDCQEPSYNGRENEFCSVKCKEWHKCARRECLHSSYDPNQNSFCSQLCKSWYEIEGMLCNCNCGRRAASDFCCTSCQSSGGGQTAVHVTQCRVSHAAVCTFRRQQQLCANGCGRFMRSLGALKCCMDCQGPGSTQHSYCCQAEHQCKGGCGRAPAAGQDLCCSMCLHTNGEQHISSCQSQVDAIPAGWEQVYDQGTGSNFYRHTATGAVQWNPPKERDQYPGMPMTLPSQYRPQGLASAAPQARDKVHPTVRALQQVNVFLTLQDAQTQNQMAIVFTVNAEHLLLLLQLRTYQGVIFAQVRNHNSQQEGWAAQTFFMETYQKKAFPKGIGWTNLEHADGRPDVFFWYNKDQLLSGGAPAGGIPAGSPAVLLERGYDDAYKVAWCGMMVWCKKDCVQLDFFETTEPVDETPMAPQTAP